MLNFLAKNRKTILGAALLMHTIENNPSINQWLPGWNFEIVDDPIANTQKLIEQMQSMGMLDILSNIRARLSGRTLSSEQEHLAILMRCRTSHPQPHQHVRPLRIEKCGYLRGH